MDKKIKLLRKKAHSLKPLVRIGNLGITEPVIAEIERCLYDHELIKIKIGIEDKSDKRNMIEKLISSINKTILVEEKGHVVTVFKKSSKNTPTKN